MADITVTSANVGLSGSSVRTKVVQAGETITEGDLVYLKTSDSKYWHTDANAEATAKAAGIAMTAAATSGYFLLATAGPVDVGGTLTISETYVVSATAGKIAPIGDMASTMYVTYLGVATAADSLSLDIKVTGTQKA